ncbi:MAG: IPTL-CTERM sorting domain-containing protein [Candidatus Levyibacteriota bacterium]
MSFCRRLGMAALASGMLIAGSAMAANVALYADTTYVDYTPPATSSEAYNMQVALTAMGHTVTTFTGTSGAAWTSALAGAQVLVVPEQENGQIAGNLAGAAVTAIQNFVNTGGILIVGEDYSGILFLNSVFGYSIAFTTGNASTITAAAASTVFAGGPASLTDNNATGGYATSSLPAGGLCAYASGTDCMVFQINQGSGKIFQLGYDFFDAVPNGTQDGGWNAVLALASGGAGPTGPVAVPTLSEYGIALLGLILAAAAALSLRQRRFG